MKALLIPTLLITALVASVSAKDYKLPKDEPLVSFSLPDKWEIEEEDESISATSDDDEILLSFEINDGDSIEGAIEETFGYLKKNKVKIDPASQKQQEATLAGMKAVNFDWKGEDESGPTNVSLTILEISKDKAVLMLYWASPDGEKKHAADLEKIATSIKKLK